MKKPIEWHKKCLSNAKDHLKRQKEERDRLTKYIEETELELDFYQSQINYAEQSKKDSFDSEKFHKKRIVNTQ